MSRPMNLGERVRLAREAMGWKLGELADRSGVAYATIQILESRNSERSKYIEQLVMAFPHERVNPDWLRSGKGQMLPAKKPTIAHNERIEPGFDEAGSVQLRGSVPVVGTAKMGDDGYYEEISTMPGVGDGKLEIQTKARHAYALKVRGDSMMPAIRDGWFVLIEPDAEPAVGEYVLIKLKTGQKMVKELLYQRADSITVISVNGGKQQTVLREDMDDQRGLQAVTAVVPPSKWKPD
jgi:phage repressor protein C with HTH and peptisase S24 domain